MNKGLVFASIVAIGFSTLLYGQADEECKTHIKHTQLLNTNTAYSERFFQNKIAISKAIAKQNMYKTVEQVYTIPLVVHVIHKGEAVGTGTNISDAQIQSAISHLNDAYSGNVGTSGNTNIQFCLASTDPGCLTTTGITRIDGSIFTDYSSEGMTDHSNEILIKQATAWPHESYYNIWIVSEINDNDAGTGTQGFAYYPGAGPSLDGAVILYNAFGYDPGGVIGYNLKSYTNKNGTAVHEVGHGLDLYHTFQGDGGDGSTCPTDAICGESGDCVGDTKKHKRPAGGCASGANDCDAGDLSEISDNYMNYSNQDCRTYFSPGQKSRMRAAISASRPGLTHSTACSAPSATSPIAADCTPATLDLNNPYGMGLKSVGIGMSVVSSKGAVEDGDVNDRTCLHTFSLDANTTYTLDISTGASNNEDIHAWIDYNNDGDFTDAGESLGASNNAKIHAIEFTTPSSPIEVQKLRMRIISDYASYNISGPCYNPVYGETEEYGVYFSASGPSTKLKAVHCGNTIGLNDLIGLVSIDGATNYEVLIENNGDGYSETLQTGSWYNYFKLKDLPNVLYNKTYEVSARAYVSGSWIAYGTVCSINTPTTMPGTELKAIHCGTTLGTFNDLLGCVKIQEASNYQWNVYNVGQGYDQSYVSPSSNNYINMGVFSSLAANITYNVRVRAKISGTWGSYSNVCTVTTPAVIPTTKLKGVVCGVTLTNIYDWVSAIKVKGAEDYEFRVVHVGDGIDETYSTWQPYSYMRMTYIPGVTFGKTYTVSCRVKVGGVWGAYGDPCTVTTPAGGGKWDPIYNQPESDVFSMKIYPNPVTDNFLQIRIPLVEDATTNTIQLYDVSGKMHLQKIINLEFGDLRIDLNTAADLSNGVYFVVLHKGNQHYSERIIIKRN